MNDVTQLLQRAGEGDEFATEQLLPLVYEELRRLAAQQMAHEPSGLTLQPTALVHEAYLRLLGPAAEEVTTPGWHSRGHFMAAAAEAMRRILVERARRQQRLRHGGGRQRIALDEATLVQPALADDLLLLDESLAALETIDPVKAQLVKLRFFAGLSEEEAAAALNISRATAARYWAYARAWLYAHASDRAAGQ